MGKEFKVNEHITLKLEEDETNIYVNGERFRQCKYLAFNIPVDRVHEYDTVQSIDDMEQKDRSKEYITLGISPEEEFWGHCSNLQAWVENEYDTRVLHRNLAFPLLKRLTEAEDPIAKKVFKDEIAKRIESGYSPVVKYLLKESYLDYFNDEEIETLIRACNIIELSFSEYQLLSLPEWITKLISLQVLDLSYNSLKELPESIVNLTSLKKLDLSFNNFTTLPESISILRSVGELKLGDFKLETHLIGVSESVIDFLNKNQVDVINENVALVNQQQLNVLFELLPHLKKDPITDSKENYYRLKFENYNIVELSLAFCDIYPLPESMAKLTGLRELDLRYNELGEDDFKSFDIISRLTALQKLNLTGNHLFYLPDITKLTALKELILEDNELDRSELIESIGDLRSLRKLSLKRNYLSNLPKGFEDLTSLEKLDLSFNQFEILPESVTKLTKLKKINLESNKLWEIPESINKLIKLEELNLKANNFTEHLELIENLESLQKLNMERNFLMQEFKIGDFLKLRLEHNIISIYIKEEKYQEIIIDNINPDLLDDIGIDEVLKRNPYIWKEYWGEHYEEIYCYLKQCGFIYQQSEFRRYCSMFQEWFENDYETDLPENIAFPLLEKLKKKNSLSFSRLKIDPLKYKKIDEWFKK